MTQKSIILGPGSHLINIHSVPAILRLYSGDCESKETVWSTLVKMLVVWVTTFMPDSTLISVGKKVGYIISAQRWVLLHIDVIV